MAAPPTTALFDQFARGWRGYALIALIALAAALFGAEQAPVMDAGEARFALVTRSLLETGVMPKGEAAAPVHLLQESAVRAFSPRRFSEIWPYRLPSALGLALAAIACLWAGSALLLPRPAFLGAALFAAGIYVGFIGMLATPDALLLGFATLAMAALAQLRRANVGLKHARLCALMFWFALVCAASIDAIAPLLITALALGGLFLWERRAAWMRPLLWWPGIVIAAIVALISFSAGATLSSTALKFDIGHMSLPGFYLVLLPLLLFPATYALPAAVRLGIEAVRAPRSEPQPLMFLLAWALPTIALCELWPTKSPHNILLAFPAIALMCGAGLTAMRGRKWRSAHPVGLVLLGVVGLVITVFIAGAATFMPGDIDADIRRAVSAALVSVLLVGGAIAGLIYWRRATARGAVLVLCALALSYSLREHILPDARGLNVSDEIVDALARTRLSPNERRTLWVVGYDEGSIVFLTRRATTLASAEDAGAGAKPGDAVVVEGRELAATQAALQARDLNFETEEQPVRGIALDNGRRVALYVGSVTSAGAASADAPPQSP
jgi:4-amino-4-deoxy-L-arabinose transferase-like glycosyltransferase